MPFVACQSEAMLHFHGRGPTPHPHPQGYYSRSCPCEAPKPILGCLGFCVCHCALWVSTHVRSHCSDHTLEWLWAQGVLCVLVSLCALWIIVQVYILDVSRAIRVRFTVCWGPENC